MAITTTLGKMLVNQALPEDMRDPGRVLDKKGVGKLFDDLAHKHPDQYRDVAHRLFRIGVESAYSSGGQSFGINHLSHSPIAAQIKRKMQAEIDSVLSDKNIDDTTTNVSTGHTPKESKIVDIIRKYQEGIAKKVLEEGTQEGNPLAEQVVSGSRGSPTNLASLKSGDLLYVDHRDRNIPIPVTRSYSQGLTPAEYYAGSFGARKGVIDVKMSTQDAGYVAKQLNNATHRLIVTHKDERPYDGIPFGLPVETKDSDNVGALLAKDVGPFKRNTVLTEKHLNHLHDLGHEHILIRSPVVGTAPDGGLYAEDAGVREKGHLSPIGDIVGIAAAQAIGEVLSQSQLCLAAGTLVRMHDWSVKPIENVKIGDMVIGSNKKGNLSPTRVVRTYFNGKKECIRSSFAHPLISNYKTELISTPDHKVLCLVSKNIYKNKSIELAPINHVFKDSSVRYCFAIENQIPRVRRSHNFRAIVKVAVAVVGDLDTYDLEVDNEDHLFVLASGLIVSNSSKHSGGIAGAAKGVSGFHLINQLVNPPKKFPGGATHAQVDGKVSSISQNPAGGHNITVNNKDHYVPVDYGLKVKVGDQVEAGDVMTDGIPNPAELITHKGIGEARRIFVNTFRDACKQADMPANRRNIELLARGLMDHIKLDDEVDNHVPGDVVPYNVIERDWQPRPGWQTHTPQAALGKYLEKPVLHYTIGTKIRPSTVKHLQQFGVNNIMVHNDPAPFTPISVHADAILQKDPDWMTSMLGSHLKDTTLKAVHRSGISSETGTSFVPSLARSVDFGKIGPFSGKGI